MAIKQKQTLAEMVDTPMWKILLPIAHAIISSVILSYINGISTNIEETKLNTALISKDVSNLVAEIQAVKTDATNLRTQLSNHEIRILKLEFTATEKQDK